MRNENEAIVDGGDDGVCRPSTGLGDGHMMRRVVVMCVRSHGRSLESGTVAPVARHVLMSTAQASHQGHTQPRPNACLPCINSHHQYNLPTIATIATASPLKTIYGNALIRRRHANEVGAGRHSGPRCEGRAARSCRTRGRTDARFDLGSAQLSPYHRHTRLARWPSS